MYPTKAKTRRARSAAARTPSYAWGVIHAAHLASNLKIPAISVIEFGVAGGNGLVALEQVALRAEAMFALRVDVLWLRYRQRVAQAPGLSRPAQSLP